MAMNENRKDSIILYETERKHMDNNESLDDFKTDVLLEYLFVFQCYQVIIGYTPMIVKMPFTFSKEELENI